MTPKKLAPLSPQELLEWWEKLRPLVERIGELSSPVAALKWIRSGLPMGVAIRRAREVLNWALHQGFVRVVWTDTYTIQEPEVIPPPAPLAERTCELPGCGKRFTPKQDWQRFCGPQCWGRVRHAKS